MTDVEKLEGEKTQSVEATDNPNYEEKFKELERRYNELAEEKKAEAKLLAGEELESGKETEEDVLQKLVKKTILEESLKSKKETVRGSLSESHKLMFDGLISNGKTVDEALEAIDLISGKTQASTNVSNSVEYNDFNSMRNDSSDTGKKFNEAYLKYKKSRREYRV